MPGATPPDYSGMTVNERLFTAGTLEQFDGAIRAGNRVLMRELLTNVSIDALQIEQIIDRILAHPTRYGRTGPRR